MPPGHTSAESDVASMLVWYVEEVLSMPIVIQHIDESVARTYDAYVVRGSPHKCLYLFVLSDVARR